MRIVCLLAQFYGQLKNFTKVGQGHTVKYIGMVRKVLRLGRRMQSIGALSILNDSIVIDKVKVVCHRQTNKHNESFQ